MLDLEREHGSVRKYLVAGGVDEPALNDLRERLRG
jgi:hypothetical protein